MRTTYVGLLVLVACGHDPTPKRQRGVDPPTPPSDTSPLNASSDREHPALLVERDQDGSDVASLEVRTPGAGRWWFELQLGPQHEGWNGHIRIGASDDAVKLFLIGADHEIAGEPAVNVDDDGTRHLLVRAETDRALHFRVGSQRTWQRASGPETHRPQYPHCELSKPDFRNPNCCQAKCMFGMKQCTAVVTSVPEGKSKLAEISIGADLEIMAGARATLLAGNDVVADGRVLAVADHSSVVALEHIAAPSKLAKARVVLDRPTECAR